VFECVCVCVCMELTKSTFIIDGICLNECVYIEFYIFLCFRE
jgi:hypothetical protein